MEEKISILIPCYNVAPYLEQCVTSVLNQSYQNLEVILIDDGSTDMTSEICENYRQADERVRVLHKQNEGLGQARNDGLAMATGSYVLHVDGDDWIPENHVKDLYDALKETGADISIGNFTSYYEEKGLFSFSTTEEYYYRETYTPQEWFLHAHDIKFNIQYCFTTAWGKLYKRSLMNMIAYPGDRRVEDDTTTWKTYLLADKITFINKDIYFYRHRDDSIAHTWNAAKMAELRSIEERIAMLDLLGWDTSVEIREYKRRLQLHIRELLRQGRAAVNDYRNACWKQEVLSKYGKE